MAAPSLPSALLADIFGSKRNDQIGRTCITGSLTCYCIDPSNVRIAITPSILFKCMNQNTYYRNASAVGIIVNGIIRMLCMPQKMDIPMGQAPGGDDLVLAWDGEFILGSPFNTYPSN